MSKYQGIIPAFYACYDAQGNVNPQAVRELTRWFIKKGVQGLYVGGSSGECIYQSKEDRKITLENVMAEAKGKITVIAHVACNNTADSQELAAHAESLGVDAIAAIPPIYFKLPPYAVAKYWNDISAAAPNTDFIIYHIPQLAGIALTEPLLKEMLKNPRVAGVKSSSGSIDDIQRFVRIGEESGREFVVFNGQDSQLFAGISVGAIGGIGGTYGAMPELYVKIYQLLQSGEYQRALEVQRACAKIRDKLHAGHGCSFAVVKEIYRRRDGMDCGGVRLPMANLIESDYPLVEEIIAMIREAIEKYC